MTSWNGMFVLADGTITADIIQPHGHRETVRAGCIVIYGPEDEQPVNLHICDHRIHGI